MNRQRPEVRRSGGPDVGSERLRILAALLVILACALSSGCARVIHERELFHPTRIVVVEPADADAVRIERPAGIVLAGWLLRGPAGAPALIYCPGNAETV
nr:hypothetical protein [Planctomycetota bacterium]